MKTTAIITTYNGEKYIKQCLDSFYNQTIKDFSIIIIDDGSIDNTKEKIKPYLKKLNITYYHKKNSGVADSRNYGISKVTTPYFLFVDVDDLIPNDLIETIEKYDNYDVLSFQSIKISEKKELISKLNKTHFDSIDGIAYLESLMPNKSNFFLAPWGYVYNKKFWDKHNFKFSSGYIMEDSGLIPKVLLNAKKVISIDYYGYYYVQTSNSIMRTSNDKKIKFKTESILYQYDNLIKYIDSIVIDDNFKSMFYDYFSGWLLWYGTTLNKKYISKYIKELNKRNILNKLRKNNTKTILKYLICRFSYRLYFKLYNML